MIIRKKNRKDSKNKMQIPRGEVIRPPSQIKNNSYSVIRTRDLDDLSSTRCAPTTTARPSGN